MQCRNQAILYFLKATIPKQLLKFIYLFTFGGVGFSRLCGLFSSCGEWGLLSSCGAWGSSLVVDHGL